MYLVVSATIGDYQNFNQTSTIGHYQNFNWNIFIMENAYIYIDKANKKANSTVPLSINLSVFASGLQNVRCLGEISDQIFLSRFISRWCRSRNIVPWPRFNIKMPSYRYRKSHCGDKTVVRSSYLHNGISYTGKMASLYWIRAQDSWNNMVTLSSMLPSVKLKISNQKKKKKIANFQVALHVTYDTKSFWSRNHFLLPSAFGHMDSHI